MGDCEEGGGDGDQRDRGRRDARGQGREPEGTGMRARGFPGCDDADLMTADAGEEEEEGGNEAKQSWESVGMTAGLGKVSG